MIAFMLALLCAPVVFPFSAWVVERSFTAGERFCRWRKDFHGTICL